MRVRVVGAGVAGGPGFALSTYVLDGVLAVDAGALGWFADAAEQARVRDVLLTHAHIDHVAGLAGFLETVYATGPEPPRVHAPEPVLSALQAHLFNGFLMPDFVALSKTLPPFLRFCPVQAGAPFPVGRYTVTLFDVDHAVPTVAVLVDDGRSALAIVTDTGPIPGVLDVLARAERLRAVFLEASFPDELADLAATTKHLTASQFLDGARRFPAHVPVYAVHIKPRYAARVRAEILAAALPNVAVADPMQVIELD